MSSRAIFAPLPEDTRRSREDAHRRWSALHSPEHVPYADLLAAHARIRTVANDISGDTRAAQKRAVIYFSIYEDSGGNFMFPMIASHGSLWGVSHTLRIEPVLDLLVRLSDNRQIRQWMHALDSVRDINRRVFVEIYTTFYFTRYYGTHPRAKELIKPQLLHLYNQVHQAVEAEELLPLKVRRSIYYDVFVHEQHDIVDPGIHAAAAMCPKALVALFSRVRPRFAYFPKGERLLFTDFTRVDQRNREGLRAMDFAEQVGAARVLEAMSDY